MLDMRQYARWYGSENNCLCVMTQEPRCTDGHTCSTCCSLRIVRFLYNAGLNGSNPPVRPGSILIH